MKLNRRNFLKTTLTAIGAAVASRWPAFVQAKTVDESDPLHLDQNKPAQEIRTLPGWESILNDDLDSVVAVAGDLYAQTGRLTVEKVQAAREAMIKGGERIHF